MPPLEWLLSLLRDETGNLSPSAFRAIPERVTAKQLRPLLRHEDEVVRYLALEMLGSRATFSDLQPHLSDKEYSIAQTAENLLLAFASPQQMRPLIKHHDGYQQEKIVRILAERATLDELRHLLRDKNDKVRDFVLKAMGERAEREDIEKLLTDSKREVRYTAFARFTQLATMDELRPYLQHKNCRIRQQAIVVYLPFATQQETRQLLHENDSDILKTISKFAAEHGMITDVEAIWRHTEYSNWKRRSAFEIYMQFASPDQLKSALLAADPKLRSACLWFARNLRDVDEFLPFLQSGTEEERCELLQVFGKKFDESHIRPLLHDKDISVRLAALQALGERATKADAEVLFLDETHEADERAFDVYIRFSSPEEWRELLYHSDADIRYKAIQSLHSEEIDHEWLLMLKDEIIPLLSDEDEIVRFSALDALHARAPAEALRLLLDDEDPYIKEIAINLLGTFDD